MKVAITATGKNWDDMVDDRFGRARGFFVIDTESGDSSYIDNSDNIEAEHGAGTGAAQQIINADIKVLIAGKVGPKADSVLRNGGVKIISGMFNISIKEAYERYNQTSLEKH